MKKTQLLLTLFIPTMLVFQSTFGQQSNFTEAYNELLKQRTFYNYPTKKWDSLRCAWYGECATQTAMQKQQTNVSLLTACPLTKRMFGWHIIGTSASSYIWQSLSDLSYFSYDVNASTGNAINSTQINNWATDPVVVAANNNGVRVSLCVTLFNNSNEFSTFFGSSSAQTTLRNNLVNAVVAANAKGINIDFEGSGLGSTYLSQFITFMSALSTQLHNTVPNSELSIDLQGSYSSSTNLINQLNPYVDLFIIMAYDYYWGSQGSPGPVAPTYNFYSSSYGNVSSDLNNFLKIISPSKIILGMPYYGRRWGVSNGCTLPGVGSGSSAISTQTFSQYKQNSNGYYSNPQRDAYTFNAYNCFNDANSIPNQQFIDDIYSFQKKYDLIKQRGIAGAAVWRLGYDNGYSELWNLVNDNISTCPIILCSDTIYDMGGPYGNYHNSEDYTFTIAPPNASSVTLSFLSFDIESGYDYLKIYNGTTIGSPLLANLSGNTLPSAVIASSGTMTVQFHSNGATTKAGYKAVYTCSTGNPCVDNYEPNDNTGNAYNLFSTPLGANSQSTTKNSYIYSGSDQDWYKINVNSGSYGTISVSLSGLPANYDLEMYDNGGLCSPCFIAGSYNTGNNSENFTFTYNSSSIHQPPFYIKAYPNNNTQYSQCNAYTLNVSWTPQTSCTYTLPVTSASFTTSGGNNNTFAINTQSGCAWTATTSDPSWITLNTASGTGTGNINYSVASNSGNSRTGYIYVQGNTFTINQSGVSCSTPTIPVPNFGNASCPGPAIYNQPSIYFSWTNSGSVFYDIEIREYPYDVTNVIYTQGCISGLGLSISTNTFIPGKLYAWRVRATTDCNTCNSNYSQLYFFHLGPSISPSGVIYICNGSGTTLTTPTITVPSPGTVSYQWYQNQSGTLVPVGSNSPNYFVSLNGTYVVALNYSGSNLCSGQVTTSQSYNTYVNISTIPNAPTLNSNSPICEGSTMTLTATAVSGSAYFWTGPNGFSSNNPAISISTVGLSADGTYYCYVTKDGCQSATATISVNILPSPNAQFSSTINGDTVTFTNNSTNATSYSWSFGDTQTSTQTNPTHIYSASGIYNVCLTANNSGCNPSSNCQQVIIGSVSSSGISGAFSKLYWQQISTKKFLGYDIIQSSVDSGFICLGKAQDNGATPDYTQYFKVDKNGTVLWARELPGNTSANAQRIVKSQNGYLISFIYNFNNLNVLMEIDELGNKLWAKEYSYNYTAMYKLLRVQTGGFLWTGNYYDGNNKPNLLITKLDDSGNISWQTSLMYTVYSSTDLEIYSMIKTSDGGYALTGYLRNGQGNFSTRDAILIKLDLNGNHLWSKQIGISGTADYALTMMENSNNQLVIGGLTSSYGPTRGYIFVTNLSGNIVNTYYLPSASSVIEVFQKPNNNYEAMCGFTIIELDANFNVLNSKYLKLQSITTAHKTLDANFILPGYYYIDPINYDYRYNLIKAGLNISSCLDSSVSNTIQVVSNTPTAITPTITTPSLAGATYSGNPYLITLVDSSLCHICNLSAIITPSGTTTFCSGDSVTISANSGMTGYLWSSGQTTQSINVSTSGNYSVAITDSNGCTATSQAIAVTVNPLPYADAGADQVICSGSSVTIGSPVVSGNTYSWLPSIGLSSPVISNPSASPTSTTTYTVTATNSFGCASSDQVTVLVNALPTIEAGNNVTISQGNSTIIGGNPTATGNSPFTYSWIPISGLNSNAIANPTASPQNTTTYIVSVVDSNGCSASDSIVVTVTPVGCNYTLSDSSYNFNNSGGSHIFTVTTSNSACTWQVTNSVSWLQISPTMQQTGNGSVSITADSCSSGSTLTGNFTVAGITYNVSQNCSTGTNCNPPIANFAASQTSGNCPFTVDFFDLSTVTGSTAWEWTIYAGGSPIISTDQNPTGILYNVSGSFLVKLKVTDSCGTDTKIIANYISVTCPTGLDELTTGNGFFVYPNPTTGTLNIVGSGIDNGNYKFALKNIIGQVVLTDNIKIDNKSIQKQFSFSELPSGLYLLTIETEKIRTVMKINKQN